LDPDRFGFDPVNFDLDPVRFCFDWANFVREVAMLNLDPCTRSRLELPASPGWATMTREVDRTTRPIPPASALRTECSC
jgi:hypothetical protein